MESLRLRLVFENGDMLSNAQKSQGLKKSWLLLQPQQQQQQLKTIASLSAYIIQTFQLHQSCPHGLLLYMDGFVLPPFESTGILKDKDIICVKKKEGVLSIEGNDGGRNVEKMQIVEKQPVNTGVLLLTNEEFDKESGGYVSEESDDESDEEEEGNPSEDSGHLEVGNAKKRKASEICQAPKSKKQKSEPPRSIENDGQPQEMENSHQGAPSKKKLSKHESATGVETNAKSAKKSDGNVESTPGVTRNEQLQKTGKDTKDATQASQSNRKLPSRSARRKAAKRRWLREMAKIQQTKLDSQSKEVENWKQAHDKTEKKDVGKYKGLQNWKRAHAKTEKKEVVGKHKGLLHFNKFGSEGMPQSSKKNEEDNQNSIVLEKPIQNGDMVDEDNENSTIPEKPTQNGDMVDEVVPIVVRPGHIRFEPLEEDADKAVEQSQLSVETFRWNGIMSKKKGQKWGIDKSSVSHRNGRRESRGYDMNSKKDTHPIEPVDFDKLPPLTSMPKEGDRIAYRLLELSSSWTPELSSYRVGEVSWYNSESHTVMLMPVTKFPIVPEKSNEDESSQQLDNSLYNEDGSLEIDFSSLVDVRVIRYGDSDPGTAKSVPERVTGSTLGNENVVKLLSPTSNKQTNNPILDGDQSKSASAPSTESGANPWEEISEALNVKKAELSKENGWGKASSSRSSSWSRRALKGSALGPTMAFLRSEKQDKR